MSRIGLAIVLAGFAAAGPTAAHAFVSCAGEAEWAVRPAEPVVESKLPRLPGYADPAQRDAAGAPRADAAAIAAEETTSYTASVAVVTSEASEHETAFR